VFSFGWFINQGTNITEFYRENRSIEIFISLCSITQSGIFKAGIKSIKTLKKSVILSAK
jgi:hypothetical protein